MSDQCDHDWIRLLRLVLLPLDNRNTTPPLEWCKHCGLLRMAGFKPRAKAVEAKPTPLDCPFCSRKTADLQGKSCRRVMCGNPECQAEGPCRSNDAEAIEAWESIRIQGKFGTVKYNCGFEAIDDIHSLQEHCVKRGMPNDPIDFPGKLGSMRNQIIRFIDALANLRDSHYEALRDRRM